MIRQEANKESVFT